VALALRAERDLPFAGGWLPSKSGLDGFVLLRDTGWRSQPVHAWLASVQAALRAGLASSRAAVSTSRKATPRGVESTDDPMGAQDRWRRLR
jgi:hypothetical protein